MESWPRVDLFRVGDHSVISCMYDSSLRVATPKLLWGVFELEEVNFIIFGDNHPSLVKCYASVKRYKYEENLLIWNLWTNQSNSTIFHHAFLAWWMKTHEVYISSLKELVTVCRKREKGFRFTHYANEWRMRIPCQMNLVSCKSSSEMTGI